MKQMKQMEEEVEKYKSDTGIHIHIINQNKTLILNTFICCIVYL